MGLIRLLTYLAIGTFIWFFIKNFLRKQQGQANKPPAAKRGELVVQCRHCGVHLPESEAINAEADYFCSADHKRRWLSQRSN